MYAVLCDHNKYSNRFGFHFGLLDRSEIPNWVEIFSKNPCKQDETALKETFRISNLLIIQQLTRKYQGSCLQSRVIYFRS